MTTNDPVIEVKEAEGRWGVFVNGNLLGTSKARFDADFAAQVLRRAYGKEIEPSS